MTYQLDKDVAEHFEFELGGFIYKMKYPSGEERKEIERVGLAIQKLNEDANKAQDAGEDTEKFKPEAEKLGKEMADLIESLVSCDNDKAPKLAEAIDNASPPVIRNYGKMMREEMSLEVPVG